ncbi:MAG: hypothetical protein M0Z88_06690 [Actinomycetota bacterium]|nr:hypothetical protein [Actinomycetota bacterium]
MARPSVWFGHETRLAFAIVSNPAGNEVIGHHAHNVFQPVL